MTAENLFPQHPVLVVDDEELFLRSFRLSLNTIGINNIVACTTGSDAMKIIGEKAFCMVVLDINLPDMRGTELLDVLLDVCPQTPVVMITAVNDAAVAVELLKKGAMDYLVKPFDEEKLHNAVRNAIAQRELSVENEALKRYLLGSKLQHPEIFSSIVTVNQQMNSLFQYVEAIAPTPFPVLITGETGAGKELFAKAIHDLCGRKGEFVTVNVAGIDDNTFADTLFGHTRGAFTGAERSRSGLIERAERGTLFLDEIGDLSQTSQVKLLRMIQNREYFPLGADVAKIADVRVIVATNKHIDELKESCSFRNDLFHRLRTHHIAIPPLRERKDDLHSLLTYFLTEAAQILSKPVPTMPPELISLLNTYHFPGNVRELRSMVFDAVSVHKSKILSTKIFRDRMGLRSADAQMLQSQSPHQAQTLLQFSSQLPTIRQTVQSLIREALERSGGNQNVAASLLGISPQALSKRLKNSNSKSKTD